MTTGQYPKRRESDEQAARRVERLEQRRLEHEQGAAPLPPALWRARLPRMTSSGRLRPWGRS